MDREALIAEQMKALDAWYEGFGSGDIEHAYSRFADDCTWSGVGADLNRVVYRGKKAIVAYQSAWVHNVWDGKMVYFPKHAVSDGNVLLAEWEDEAISAQTGEKYTNRGVFVFEFDGTPVVQRAKTWFDTGPLAGDHADRFAMENVKTEIA